MLLNNVQNNLLPNTEPYNSLEGENLWHGLHRSVVLIRLWAPRVFYLNLSSRLYETGMKVSDLKQVLEKALFDQGFNWASSWQKNRDSAGKSELEPRSPDSQAGAASTTKSNTLQALSLSLPQSLSAPLPFPAPPSPSSPGLETESISFPASSEVRDEADLSPHLLSCLPSQDLPSGAPAWALDQRPRTLPVHLAQGPFLQGLNGAAAAAALFRGKGRRSPGRIT